MAGRPHRGCSPVDLAEALVATGFAEDSEMRAQQGAAIAREAGARVTGWNTDAPSADFVLAGSPLVAGQLEKVLRELAQ